MTQLPGAASPGVPAAALKPLLRLPIPGGGERADGLAWKQDCFCPLCPTDSCFPWGAIRTAIQAANQKLLFLWLRETLLQTSPRCSWKLTEGMRYLQLPKGVPGLEVSGQGAPPTPKGNDVLIWYM